MYAYFDGRDMSTYVTPSSQDYSNITSPVEGSALITNGAGKVEFSFRIPEYRFQGQESQPVFRSGELEFRLTSSSTNNKATLPLSAGQTTYISSGVIETRQETIRATRNAEVVQETVNETTSIFDTSVKGTRINVYEDRPRDRVSAEDVRLGVANAATGIAYTTADVNSTIKDVADRAITHERCFGYSPSDPLAQTFLVQ